METHQPQAVIQLEILQRLCGRAVCFEHDRAIERRAFANYWFRSRPRGPRPSVSKPQMRKNMQDRILGAAIESLDAYTDVLGVGFGILDEDIEIPVVVENAGIEQLEFRPLSRSPAVFFHQMGVRKLSLRVFVKHTHVTVRRRVVEVEIIFFHVLAVIAFRRTEPEHSFFQDWIAPVPKRERENEKLVTIADARNPVFSPAVRFAARQIVGEEAPGITIGAVIFPHGGPGAFAHIRSPSRPARDRTWIGFLEPLVFAGLLVGFLGHRRISAKARSPVSSDRRIEPDRMQTGSAILETSL